MNTTLMSPNVQLPTELSTAAGDVPDTTLYEFCDWRDVAPQIDRPRGILRGVKILGVRSQNGRVYLPEALAAAVGLYEGAKVNVNHPKGHPRAPRGYEERIGALRGVTVRPGEGLFGDFHFNPRHALAEQLLWDASNAPQNVGLSHNVEARLVRRDQQWVVEAIARVLSVDLVADPATTAGLFEQAATVDFLGCSAQGCSAQSCLGQVERRPSNVDAPRCEEAVAAPRPPRRVGDLPQAPASPQALTSLDELTCEQLRAGRPDLVEALLTESHATLQTELEQLRRQAAEHSAATRLAQRRDQIAALLTEYHLPPAGSTDPLAKAITSEAFVAALLEADDEAAMRSLMVERAELLEAARQRATRSEPVVDPPARPVSRSPRTVEPAPLDMLSFVRALRG